MSCCPTTATAVSSDYVAKSIPMYETGPAVSDMAIVFIYDIFGLSPQSRQVADILASSLGSRVLIPDFFDGKPWPIERFPPREDDDLMGWIHKEGNPTRICNLLAPIIERLHAQSVKKVGLVGFCWGAQVALHALKEKMVASVALCHPSFINDKDFADGIDSLHGAVAILRSKDDPVMQATKDMFAAANSPKFVFVDFNNMHHGFMGARADFKNEDNRQATGEGIEILKNFFCASMLGK